MKFRHLAPVLILSLAVAFAGRSAEAQHRGGGGGRGGSGGGHGGSGGGSHGGGSHGGGGYGGHGGGGGYAVPRSSGGHAYYGGVAGARHPQAGTGGYGHYNGGHGGYYGGHYGGHYGGYYGGGYYRPYYGGYGSYYGYAPYLSASLYFGWPYYNSWPYAAGTVGYSYPSYSLGYAAPAPVDDSQGYGDDERPAPPARVAQRAPAADRESGSLRLEVRPEDTSVYVDDDFRGTAREARSLRLPPGRHTIELVRPGYATEQRQVEVVTGQKQDVLVEMQRPR